jgi:hypothetical protein
MNATITYLTGQEHVNELRREARRHARLHEARPPDPLRGGQRRPKVRRVAVVRPDGNHFRLRPAR